MSLFTGYGIFGLIFAPFFPIGAFRGQGGLVELLFAVGLPVLYAFIGFIGGIITAALYNQIAKWTGGLEFEVSDGTPKS